MKKKIISVLSIFVLVFTLTACGNKSGQLESGLSLDALAQDLLTKIEFQDKDLAPIPDKIRDRYMNQVDFSKVKNSAIYAGGGFIAEEIALFEANSPEDAEAIEKSIESRFEYFKTSFGNYTPEQLKNLEDPVLVRSGNYVLSVISPDNKEANNIVKAWIDSNSK